MNEDKYLLYWTLKAIHSCRAEGTRPGTLLSETLWKNLGAPAWVLPAMREAHERFGMTEVLGMSMEEFDREKAMAEWQNSLSQQLGETK